MRLNARNKQPVWYANYAGVESLYDEDQYEIGQKVIYTNPVKAYWNISVVESDSDVQMFGVKAFDTIVGIAERNGFDLTETSVLWWGVEPEIKCDGTTDTPHNYRVVGIRPSLNHVRFYAQKVTVS